jgi:hypothetical protein
MLLTSLLIQYYKFNRKRGILKSLTCVSLPKHKASLSTEKLTEVIYIKLREEKQGNIDPQWA